MADRPPVFLIISILVLVTILLIFAMKYFSAARQARLKIISDNDYRQLAEKAANASAESASALTSLKTRVADIDGRLASVEKVLKDVG